MNDDQLLGLYTIILLTAFIVFQYLYIDLLLSQNLFLKEMCIILLLLLIFIDAWIIYWFYKGYKELKYRWLKKLN